MTTDMLDIKGRKIVLIGGAGFIGHHLALGLKAQGADVEVIDSLQVNNLMTFSSTDSGPNRNLYLYMINQRLELMNAAGIPLHIQDARDYHNLNKILVKINPEVVIHLAAVSHAGKSNKDPYSTILIIALEHWKMRWIIHGEMSNTLSIFHRVWCMVLS